MCQLGIVSLLFLGAAAVPAAAQQASPEQQAGQQPAPQATGSISGTIVDLTGAVVVGAQVRLTREDQSPSAEVLADDLGQFSFANVAPGPFQLTISFTGLNTQVISGTVHPGEAYVVPQVVLLVATQVTQVTVSLTQVELAETQIKEQEQQRILGIVPNFYVSYLPDAVALSPKQKFELAGRSSVDPFTFVGVGVLAGLQQAGNGLSGYGQGAQGYAKRYGAAYGDVVIGTFLGSAILPSILRQDPRYFYKGTGTKKSRLLYALSSPFVCKGDNGSWQPNYSYVIGNFAAAGIAYTYYPASNRGGWLVAETALIRFGENSLASVLQEFVIRKLTPKVSNRAQTER
ncbi:MAG: carboxypeptidase-like regulatory domain-containing protein [Candidatus Acidiferrales bacterium]